MKKQSWKIEQEIPDFPPPPFPEKSWREVLLDLKHYIQEFHSKEQLTLLLVERLLADDNIDIILIDWKNLQSNLEKFKDEKISGYLTKLNNLIPKI